MMKLYKNYAAQYIYTHECACVCVCVCVCIYIYMDVCVWISVCCKWLTELSSASLTSVRVSLRVSFVRLFWRKDHTKSNACVNL